MLKNILVVEDEAITALDIKFQLNDAGYNTFVVDNALDAYKICDEEDIDLLVADINIKGDINGIEMAEEISGRDIKVIFLSANPNDILINLRNGQEIIYIKKPININEFKEIIDSLFE